MLKKKGPTKAQFIRVANKADREERIFIDIRGRKARWTNGQILVFDDPVLGDIKGGKYTVYGKAIVASHKGLPNLNEVIPDRRKYKVAQPVRFNGMFQIWRRDDGMDVVPLESKDYRVYIDFEYYDYLFRDFVRLGKLQWKITHPERPVLLYCNGKMVAMVMPFKVKR